MTVALMEMNLGLNAYDIVSMTTMTNSNLLTAAHMEKKLGTHVYYVFSMVTIGIFSGLTEIYIVVYKMSGDK